MFYERRERRGLGFGGLGKPRTSFFCRSKITGLQKMATLVYYRMQQLSGGFLKPYGDQNAES